MRRFIGYVAKLLRNDDGPTAVEYAIMLALIILVCFVAISTLGNNVANTAEAASGAFP